MRFDSSGNPWFAISEFNQQAYCEVQLKYKWAGVKVVTPAMKKGTQIHKELERKFEKETESFEEVSIWEALELAKQGKTCLARELRVMSHSFRLHGIIDHIEIGPGGIIITDDKPGDFAYMSSQIQLFMYGIAFKDFYRPDFDIKVKIRNRDSGKNIWEGILTEDVFELMKERIQRMTELALGEREFEPTKKPNKCKKCGYRNICEFNKLL